MSEMIMPDSQEPTPSSPDSADVFVATLADGDVHAKPIRTGSPFVSDPPEVYARARLAIQMRREFEAGMWRNTASGATLASGLLLFFVVVAMWVFPTGALLIAGLGGVMGLLGLTSVYPRWSLGFLLGHVGLFVATFWRTVSF